MFRILFVFFLLQFLSYSSLFPHKIWMYWDTGYDNLGNFQKLTVQRIKELHKQTDWQFNFVDDKNAVKLLNQRNYKKYQQLIKALVSYPQLKADLIRYYLLKQYGGVWLDASIIITQNLNWLDHILENPRVIHKNIYKDPQVFIHYQHLQNSNQTIKVKWNGHDYYPLFQIQNAFIASVKDSKFISDLIIEFQTIIASGQYYYNKMQDKYDIPYTYSTYFRSFRACSINQYRRYAEYKQAKDQHKQVSLLNHYFYKTLIINRLAGMYHNSGYQRIQKLLRQDGEKGDYQTFLIKLSGSKTQLIDFFTNNLQIKEDRQIKIQPENYKLGQKYIRKSYDCLYKMQIRQNSAISRYFFSNTQLTKRYFPHAQIIKTSQLPLICRMTYLSQISFFWPIIAKWIKKVIILLALVDFAFYFFAFSIRVTLPKIKQINSKILIKLSFAYVIFMQMNLIYSQYSLWKQDSPTAGFVICILVFLTSVLFKWFININLYKQQWNIKYWFKLLLLTLAVFYSIYNNTIWKYQGQIYNYQILNRLNHEKIVQAQIYLLKIVIMLLLAILFQVLKCIFGFTHFATCYMKILQLRHKTFNLQQNHTHSYKQINKLNFQESTTSFIEDNQEQTKKELIVKKE